MALEIVQILVGPMHVFCYLIGDSSSGEAIVVDPGADGLAIFQKARERNWDIKEMIFTHGHADHVAAASALKNLCGASCRMHELEMDNMKRNFNLNLIQSLGGAIPPEPSGFVADGDEIKIGEEYLTVLHLPGHSPGSIGLSGEDYIFTGDVLFEGGIGRVDLPGSESDKMDQSLKKLLDLPPNTRVYPGHAYGPSGSTTIGRERDNNPCLGPVHLC